MKPNLKVVKTEQLIQKAFIKIVSQKSFSKLTVNAIITEAHISRGTFYLHYADKFDLLAHYESALLAEITTIFQRFPKPLSSDNPLRTNQNAFYQLFNYLSKNRELTNVLLQNSESDIVKRVKALIFNEIQLTGPSEKSADQLPIPEDYAREIIVQNILLIIVFWLNKTTPENSEVVFNIFLRSRQLSPIDLSRILSK